MPRIRTIQPFFPKSASMSAVSRDARLLFILLWIEADDAGRLYADPNELVDLLFHYDDARPYISQWLAELEGQGCIERYAVNDEPLVRIVNWRKYQKIDRPTPSQLPLSPTELATREAREARERSRARRVAADKLLNGQENSRPTEMTREEAYKGPDAATGPEEGAPESPEAVLTDLARIQRDAEDAQSFAAALRSVELRGRRLGLWSAVRKEGAEPASGDAAGSTAIPTMDQLFPKESRKAAEP